MARPDEREKHLGWIEVQLRRDHPEFPHLRIIADSHHVSRNHVTCVEIWGVKEPCWWKEIQEQAKELVNRPGSAGGSNS